MWKCVWLSLDDLLWPSEENKQTTLQKAGSVAAGLDLEINPEIQQDAGKCISNKNMEKII